MHETINGRQIAKEVLSELADEIKKNNLNLRLAAVLVGDSPEIKKFVELKKEAAQSVGIEFDGYYFSENISEEELQKEVLKICSDSRVNGVFVELPLPKHINAANILRAIPPDKDLDALSSRPRVLPPTVQAVKIIFEKYNIDPHDKKVAVFGYGLLVGRPVSEWLKEQGADLSVIDVNTKNPQMLSGEADIIISGVGKPGLITGDMVKEGAVVIDFGYGKKDVRMVGDVDFESVAPKASLITPVPGGVGPILIAAVLKNLVDLNK